MNERKRIDVLGVKVDQKDLPEVLHAVEAFLPGPGRKTVMYLNVHCMNIAFKDREYREILNRADLVYCDGFGIVMGARLLGETLPERMTGADWIYDLADLCSKKGYSLFLLGGEQGVAEAAGEKLRSIYDGIRIVGTHHGYLSDVETAKGALEMVNNAKPDILLVGMGSPIQEKFLDRYRDRIEVPVCWVVGALFDFVSGISPRAPRWMLDNGLEWLYRLLCEPRRMWRRYLVGNTSFLLTIAGVRLKNLFR